MGNEAIYGGLGVKCKPFLKWAGGKGQLLSELLARIPQRFNRYFEPFVGGGALFFGLQPKHALLSDINLDLINTYTVVRDSVEHLIADLSQHVYEKDYFYQIRDTDRSKAFDNWSNVQRASRLIYLNKTCFNGLYRINSKGQFNVPFGRYTNPKICDATNLRACSQVLQSIRVEALSFDHVVDAANSGDFVYFDPPYAPLNATSYFTSYSKDGFDTNMQIKLRDTCVALDRRGVRFMLSNSSAPLILDLYKNFQTEFVQASRAINSKASLRGKINEVIVRNYTSR